MLSSGAASDSRATRLSRYVQSKHRAEDHMHTAHEMSDWSAFSLHESILDSVSANVAILDDAGDIIAVNDAWIQFAEFNALPFENYGLGLNYISLCESLDAPDASEAR